MDLIRVFIRGEGEDGGGRLTCFLAFLAGRTAMGEDEEFFFDFDQDVESAVDLGHFDAFLADGGDGFIANLIEERDLNGSEVRGDFGGLGGDIVLHIQV